MCASLWLQKSSTPDVRELMLFLAFTGTHIDYQRSLSHTQMTHYI